MPRSRRRKLRSLRIRIDDLDIWTLLVLQVGASETDILRLTSWESLQEIWVAVRDDLMPSADASLEDEHHAAPGTRPWAWWKFEAKESIPPTPAEQLKRLQELNVLEGWEAEGFDAWYRQRVRMGTLRLLTDPEVRREHIAHRARELGVPPEKIEQWIET